MAQYVKFETRSLGEYYADLLALDAATNGSTIAGMAIANIKQCLHQKERLIEQKIAYEAFKKGVSVEAHRASIIGHPTPVRPMLPETLDLIKAVATVPEEKIAELLAYIESLKADS